MADVEEEKMLIAQVDQSIKIMLIRGILADEWLMNNNSSLMTDQWLMDHGLRMANNTSYWLFIVLFIDETWLTMKQALWSRLVNGEWLFDG